MIDESKHFKNLVKIIEEETAKIKNFDKLDDFGKSKASYEIFMDPERKYIESLHRETKYVVDGHPDDKKIPGARKKAYEVAKEQLGKKSADGKLNKDQADDVLKAYAMEFLNQSVNGFGDILKKEKKRVKEHMGSELSADDEKNLIFQLFNQLIASNPNIGVNSIEDYKKAMTKATGIGAIDDLIAEMNQNTINGYVNHVAHKVRTKYLKDEHQMKWQDTLLSTLNDKKLIYKDTDLLTKTVQELASHHGNLKYNLPFKDPQTGKTVSASDLGYYNAAPKK